MITLITLLVHYMIDLMPLKYEEQQVLVVLQIAITENHEGEQTFWCRIRRIFYVFDRQVSNITDIYRI